MTITNRDGDHGCTYVRTTDSIMEFLDVNVATQNRNHSEGRRIFADKDFTEDQVEKAATQSPGSSRTADGRWVSTPMPHTMRQWKQLYVRGWEWGTKILKAQTAHLLAGEAEDLRRKPVRAEFGDELDIHRVYRGQLDTAWSTKKPKFCPRAKQITLWLDVNAMGSVGSEEYIWRGAAVLALARSLEKAGYQVAISLYETIGDLYVGKGHTHCCVQIKKHGERINWDKAALLMCHPNTLRTAFFGWELSMPARARGGMGYVVQKDPVLFKEGDIKCGAYIIGEKKAREWLDEQMKPFLPQTA
jgi:hypothetical protein